MVYPDPSPIEPLAPLTLGQRRMIAVAEVLLCSSLPTQLLIGSLLRATGWQATVDGNQLSPPFVFTLLLVDSIVLIVPDDRPDARARRESRGHVVRRSTSGA